MTTLHRSIHGSSLALRARPRRRGAALISLAALVVGCGAIDGDGEPTPGEAEVGQARQAYTSAGVLGHAACGDRVRLKSWKGDYLHRPDSPQDVTTWALAGGDIWTVECLADGNVQLRSWKGDYLHRPDSPQGVTTWAFGEWTVVPAGDEVMLRSWKGDYLHRPDSPQGVTTWDTGIGNLWSVEVLVLGDAACNDEVRLRSWKGDYLNRPDGPADVTSSPAGNGNTWTVECLADGNIQLRSWKGDYLHRPDSPQGVTTWAFGEWTVVPAGGQVMLRSWKGDYLHRPDSPQGVTTWNTGIGDLWTVEVPDDSVMAYRFAPRLRFDGAANGYPMSAEAFYEAAIVGHQTARIENTDPGTLPWGAIPTYYQVISCGAQVRIKYWWFYGYQGTCDQFGNGTHNGDWEGVVVTLSEDRSSIAAVTFTMHGHTYTRLAARSGFEVEEATHPVVYVGKNSHASHYTQGGSGVADNCLPWEEYRNNWSGAHMDSWLNLVDTDSAAEPWMVADHQSAFAEWGPNGGDGVSTHPTQAGPSCSMNAADWTWDVPTWWHSQCKRGDRDDGTSCHTQCRPGYTDMGLTCTNWSWDSLDTYGQHIYGYDYTLPTSDVGLLTNDYD